MENAAMNAVSLRTSLLVIGTKVSDLESRKSQSKQQPQN
jgi:hypothetical protein